MKTKLGISLLAFAVLVGLAVPAFAEDPPSRVLRLKYISGQVSFQPGGVNDWAEATINRPLTTADRIWTDKDSKAELTLATAALRINSETSLTVTNLTDNTVQVELDQGTLNLRVNKLYSGEIYEVDTPNMAFTITKSGEYRFEVDSQNDLTYVIVRKGEGEANGDGRGVRVGSGQMARFEHGNTLMHTVEGAPGLDGFDDWCRVRDQRERNADSIRYVSSDVIGYEDLDEYGYWRPVPTYGYVWVPRGVAVGWAPYRYGRWVWVSPWGWTWVDDAPWGFAPFHYGRWVNSSYGWAWCPGPRIYRSVYAPALVGWVGGGNWGIGLSFGFGPGIGWVPLGWGEPYYPYYRVSPRYVRNVNISNTHITNITYVTNNYNNWNRGHDRPPMRYMNQHGMTAAPQDALVHSRPIGREAWKLSAKDATNAPTLGRPNVTPDKWSALGREHARPVAPPSRAFDRQVVSKLTPPARPTSFTGRGWGNDPAGEVKRDRLVGSGAPRPTPMANAGSPATPSRNVPRPPTARTFAEDGTSRGSDTPATPRAVPRPPADRRNVADGGSGLGPRRPAAETPRREVPRPPADRRPTSAEDQPIGSSNPGARVTPSSPETRRPAVANESPRAPRNDRPSPGPGRSAAEVNRPVPAPRQAAPERRVEPRRSAPERDTSRPSTGQGIPQARMYSAPRYERRATASSSYTRSEAYSYRAAPQRSYGNYGAAVQRSSASQRTAPQSRAAAESRSSGYRSNSSGGHSGGRYNR